MSRHINATDPYPYCLKMIDPSTPIGSPFYTQEYGTEKYVGFGYDSSYSSTATWLMWASPSDPRDEKPQPNSWSSLPATATVTNFIITLTLTGSSGSVVAVALAAKKSLNDKTDFNAVAYASDVIGTYAVGQTHTIRITDRATMEKIMRYGLGLRPASTGSWRCSVDAMTVEYDYADPAEPPVIALSGAASAYLTDSYALAWTYAQSGGTAQASIDCEYVRAETAETVTLAAALTLSASAKTFTLPDFPLTPGEGTLRLRARTASAVSAWEEIPLVLLASEMAPVSPDGGANCLAAQAIRLTWTKAAGNASATDPAAFDVEYSTSGGETWTRLLDHAAAAKSGANWYKDVPANTLRHGPVRWRVRAWQNAAYASAFAAAAFQAVVQASTSAVTCDGKPRPTLSWTSESQAAYQVRFSDYDSGAVFGAATSHKVPRVYADGLYPVQVRTQATTGAWSAWTDVEYVQITNVPPSGAVTLAAKKTRHSVTLSWGVSGTFAGYVLYRSGVPVYAGTAKSYEDAAANGKQTYTVRAVTEAGYYLQSAPVAVDCTPAVDCIRLEDGETWIPLRYFPDIRQRSYTVQPSVSYLHFAGRRLPVAFSDGFAEELTSIHYLLRERDTADAVSALAGKNVIWKGTDGGAARGVLGDVSHAAGLAEDITLQITATAHKAEADYDL